MKTKGKGLVRFLIVLFAIILIVNSCLLVREIRTDASYLNRSYGLTAIDDCYNNGEYYQVWLYTLKNRYVDDKPYVDVSEYEAFGEFYGAYLKARMYPDKAEYREQMKEAKERITWKKILSTVNILENELEK